MPKPTDWTAVERNAAASSHKAQVAELQEQIKLYASKLSQAEAERDTAFDLTESRLGTLPKIVSKNPSAREATVFAVAGDWHVEETVEAKTINGLNEYNLIIAEERILNFFKSIVRLTEIERHGTTIENLVLVFLGDLMTGYIHEELQESNGLSPTETVLWLRRVIVAGIRYLQKAGGFKKIVIPCVYGNHGRTTKKPRHATGAKNSYEWMLYQILRIDLPECEWLIADGYFQFVTVYDRLFRVHHGDNVKYGGGIGGLTIPAEKALASWNKGMSVQPYMDIFGHHHQAFQTPRWMCNGSAIGYGAYALSIKAGFELPMQTLFLLDSKRGRTATWPIYL